MGKWFEPPVCRDSRRVLAGVVLAAFCATAHSEEGMWPPAHVPLAHVERTFGVKVAADVLTRIRLATMRFGGATAFFVSPNGLVITNHHVALRCLQSVSTPERNYYATGFLARATSDELRCPGQDARVLMSYADVTTRFERVYKLSPAQQPRAVAELESEIENTCASETGLTCEVTALYGGARRMLYRYKRYEDVRLVAAPEAAVAYFGGDPDNFEYPRYGLDVTLLRLYEREKPVSPPAYLAKVKQRPVEGQFAIGAGHPNRTSRWLPVSQLELLRDIRLPFWVAAYDRRIKLLEEYQQRSTSAQREASAVLFFARNTYKREAGYLSALRDPQAIQAQRATFDELSRSLEDESKTRALTSLMDGGTRIAEAERRYMAEDYFVAHNLGSRLLEWAVLLVRWAEETSKDETARLEDFRGARLRETERWIASRTPAFPALDAVLIADRWAEAARVLGATHAYVRAVANVSVDKILSSTAMGNPEERARLLKGGPTAIRESDDPLIVLARRLEPYLYAVRARHEKEIKQPLAQLETELAKLRLATSAGRYSPDANATLRFAFGRTAGYREGAVEQPWATTLRRMYERAEQAGNKRPEALPPIWRERRDAIDLDTKYNFVATIDHAGGNSGSPVTNEKGEWFGVQHDGNRQNFGTQYVYSAAQARMIAVHADAIIEWLRVIMRANALVQELVGND